MKYFEKNYSKDPSRWFFGKVQTVTLRYYLLGNVPILRKIFNSRKTLPITGSFSSFAMTHSGTNAPLKYNVSFSSTLRYILSFDDIDKTKSITPSGSSGHIFNKNREV